jgi:LPXTG-site transpeptidase (sortase) family protein
MKLGNIVAPTSGRAVARYFFLGAGVICLGLYGYEYAERTLYQAYESGQLDRTLRNRGVATATVALRPAAGQRSPSRHPSPAETIGRLSVPRLHLSAIGHIPSTALPWQGGNVGVAGHRDTFFRGLKDLKTGDEIRFATLSGDFRYAVESLIVVEADNAEALAASSENMLTLVTCYPFYYVGAAPKRFVATARQVSPQALAQSGVK